MLLKIHREWEDIQFEMRGMQIEGWVLSMQEKHVELDEILLSFRPYACSFSSFSVAFPVQFFDQLLMLRCLQNSQDTFHSIARAPDLGSGKDRKQKQP